MEYLKAHSGLRQFLATESSFTVMKNVFYFTLKALFVLEKYLNFCPDIFSHLEKQLDKRAEVVFKIDDVINWKTKLLQYTYSPISQEVKAIRQ